MILLRILGLAWLWERMWYHDNAKYYRRVMYPHWDRGRRVTFMTPTDHIEAGMQDLFYRQVEHEEHEAWLRSIPKK